jgi:hypothetical protein
MKALSFRQPWAELILQGRKTLDLRTYTRDYRGPLAIHAAMEIEQAACRQFGLDPAALPRGGLVGTVILVDIVPLDEAAYTARTAEHLAGRHFREPMYGWVLRQPQRLPEVIPLRGQRNLFAIEPDSIPLADAVSPNPAAPTAPVRASQPAVHQLDAGVDRGEGTSQARPFELLVVPDTATDAGVSYALTLRQRAVQPADDHLYAKGSARLTTIVTLGGDTLRAIADQVIDALRQAGYRPTDLAPGRSAPFYLPEAAGVRLGLLMLAVKPLSKPARIEAIAHGIRVMPPEEAYYWYSKCTARETAARAQAALRVLLGGV